MTQRGGRREKLNHVYCVIQVHIDVVQDHVAQ